MNRGLRGTGTSGTALAHVQGQLEKLARGFGLDAQATTIRDSFDAIFRHSLDFPLGTRPAAVSRLNEDGSAIQFATAVGADVPGLRFVGDVGPVGDSGADRNRVAREAIGDVAGIVGIRRELDEIMELLDAFAPQDDPILRRDQAGAFWIGLAFAPGIAPRLRLYINGSWGKAPQRWARVAEFAARAGQARAWDRVRKQLPSALEPLGLAITLASGEPPLGTVYLRAFGVRMSDYARAAETAAGPAVAAAIGKFATALLGDDAAYPTPAAVMSFGLGPISGTAPTSGNPGPLSAELEICGHCLWRDDAEARARLMQVIAGMGLDPGAYLTLADELMTDPRKPGPPRVHSFIGVDSKSPAPVLTVYMKPDLYP